MSLSFSTISSSGPNGAVIHYHPAEATDRPITKDEMYLVDSGGQYRSVELDRDVSRLWVRRSVVERLVKW